MCVIVTANGTINFAAAGLSERAVICAAPAIFQHKALLINVNRTGTETSLYDATHSAWKISRTEAEQAEVVHATRQGLIIGAFIAEKSLDATPENFPGREESPGRLGLVGYEAPAGLAALYVGKRVLDEFRKPGAAIPIKYTW